jgi:hypothetical protein
MGAPGCSLCETDGGVLVYRAARFRVVRAEEPGFPAFYRVIWNDHVDWDSHFPSPAWAAAQRASPADRCAGVEALRDQTEALMVRKLQALGA